MVTTSFRVYQTENSRFQSSLFDLMDGDRETKQTKGLAYLFKLSPEFLKNFLAIGKMSRKIRGGLTSIQYQKYLACDYITVDAEMTSSGMERVRRDITLTFYSKSKKVLVLILEAKNIKLERNKSLEEQMQRYVDPQCFPQDKEVPTLAAALTKYEQPFITETFLSLTWIEIIHILHKTLQQKLDPTKIDLINDYYKFITGVDKGMKYYEREILSVSAAKTFQEITNHHIHACPNTTKYNYRDPIFITFRKKGGEMDKLYKIEEIRIIPPGNLSVLNDISKSNLPYKERLLKYIEDRKKSHGFKSHDTYRFYILSEHNNIELSHRPRPEKNNAGGWYYTLSEMLKGEKVVVTDSK
ncbi:hypothetical protein FIU87_03320 [Bacillus sp. THAF10]|uniref:hypothetical protein n=1 Tax=Bacillus sp. THAF10 TaxID=2587848 RepID=UPI001268A5C3|nr:hypothetical protein [Bacillus sp. THAF10]QFT87672.1 hypothetical protein FIU87_03320 [Bacillus sp. THAF10]